MFRRTIAFAFVISCSLAFGQLDSNTVTVTATTSATLQLDQIVLEVDVSAGVDQTFDNVIGALAGSGITIANFSGINSYSLTGSVLPTNNTLTWSFTVPVSFSQMKTEVAALTTLQNTVAQKNNGMALQFFVQGTQISTQAQQAQVCSVPDLIAGARSEAQTIAAAAAFNLGNIVSMSSVTSSTAVCTLTVKFQLLRMS